MISLPMQVLELDNCSLLTSVSLDLPRLQNIRLVYCRKYVSTSFSLPQKTQNSIINICHTLLPVYLMFKKISNP